MAESKGKQGERGCCGACSGCGRAEEMLAEMHSAPEPGPETGQGAEPRGEPVSARAIFDI